MSKCLGVDIGYGYTKTYDGEKAKIFPTAVTAMVPYPSFSELCPVIVNGEKFLVGEEAEREVAGLLETRASGFILSSAWLAILGRALSINEFNQDEDVLVLGISQKDHYKAKATEIVDAISMVPITDTLTGSKYGLSNCIIKVMPQGAGIYFSYLSENPNDSDKDIAVIDIGLHTLDMGYFSRGKYTESATESHHLGVSVVLDRIVKAFYMRHGFAINYSAARKLLGNPLITIQETDYYLDNIRDIISPYFQQLVTIVDNFCEKLPGLDIGITGGGGVLVLGGKMGVHKLKRKLWVVSQPEMANAIGYFLYGNKFVNEAKISE